MSNGLAPKLPACSTHVSAASYSSAGQASFQLTSATYYKNYVESDKVLPGLIFGILCWILAVLYILWLFAICCRKVVWHTKRRKNPFDQSKRRKPGATILNLLLFISCLGVIATGIWALIEGLHSTNGIPEDFWAIVTDAKTQLISLSATLSSTGAALLSIQNSIAASDRLLSANSLAFSVIGIDATALEAQLNSLESSASSGYSATSAAQNEIQTTALGDIAKLENSAKAPSEQYWKSVRVAAVVVFFGLLIVFGILATLLALMQRTPRLTATLTLLLLIWTGFVLFIGAGLLSLVWRVSGDFCLYGVDYAAAKVGGGGSTALLLNYYFQRVTIPSANVSQTLFNVNLPSIIASLNDPKVQNFTSQLTSTQGQILVATASSSDRTDINLLSARLGYLGSNLTNLNTEIQAQAFSTVTDGIQSLICCTATNALWSLWIASILTGAFALMMSVLLLIKVCRSVRRKNCHNASPQYTPESPNKAVFSPNRVAPQDPRQHYPQEIPGAVVSHQY